MLSSSTDYNLSVTYMCCFDLVQQLANAKEYGHEEICKILQGHGGFIKVWQFEHGVHSKKISIV